MFDSEWSCPLQTLLFGLVAADLVLATAFTWLTLYKDSIAESYMKLYIVMLNSEILFVGSCAVDAAEFSKKIENSCVITCQLNGTTAAGLNALEVQTF
jgi:hypothetical protein